MSPNPKAAPLPRPTAFGDLLRHWRRARRLSQLALSAQADVSARHLCFLETGRAQPSRDMVRQLGAALDMPLADQNLLHAAAGYVPPFDSSDLDAAGHRAVREALDLVLAQQEPYPALVIDGRWDVRARNQAALRLFAPFVQSYEMASAIASNAMHVVFHPRGLRPFIVNWEAFAGHLIQVLHHEAAQGSPAAQALREEILRYPDLPDAWVLPHAKGQPLTTMQLARGDLRLNFFTTLTTFAMPCDVALQQLKIECFYPADERTAAHARHAAKTLP